MEYIFIYGLFRDSANGLLNDAIFCDKAFVYGNIYMVNEFYPGFIRKNCDHKVYGDIYLIDPNIFKDLDEFEGDEYIRKKIFTSIGEEVWIYEYKYDVSKFEEIKNGDWLLR